MFGLFKKNPTAKLEKQRARLLEEAVSIQRSGDLRAYAAKMEEVADIERRIDELNAAGGGKRS